MKKTLLILLVSFFSFAYQSSAQRVKKVVFQGFWWDYWNTNFKNKWADYITELAPRLKAIGIDAIWVPAAQKCSAPSSVGYSPFDHYDLGDKYQKGGSDSIGTRTRMGNKNELLRMVAVLHANGMEVIEDIVLNHNNDAGTNTGSGGIDPQSPYSIANNNGYKNFRYVSYGSPLIDESQNDYWTRAGRWPKNYTNFYPNAGNNCTTGDICSPFFGPDIAYDINSFGPSSNIPTTGQVTIGAIKRNFVNPPQAQNYMRDQSRNWLMWLKKQAGFDGWRFDAVKHYPIAVQEDLIYNTKYMLPDFAKGGDAMFCLGEWIGTKTEIDNYMLNVRSGSELSTGTFDFGLRGYCPSGGLYNMVLSQGNYNMQLLPGEQQSLRYYDYPTQRVYRTVPFVNNHDNFRPILSSNGNYSKPLGQASGWNTSQELGGNGQHLDPREPRLYAAYATVFAMDGNPAVFFEDLFDIGTTGKRWSHLPTNATDLPVRRDLVNIIQAHQALKFKNGDYAVPTSLAGTQAPFYAKGTKENHLVIERTNQAIIGIADKYNTGNNNNNDEEVWISVSGAWRNIDLYDYSGAHGVQPTRVFADGRVLIKTAPVAHTISGALGHGYSIWAPKPAGVNFVTINDMFNYLATNCLPTRATNTVQEWEMADDLGDSHAKSLKQGGQLPEKSTAERLVGSIFVDAGKPLTCKLFPEVNGYDHTISIYSGTNVLLTSISGLSSNTSPLVLSFIPSTTGWLSIKVKNSTASNIGQRVWMNVSYTAPMVLNTRTTAAPLARGMQEESIAWQEEVSEITEHIEAFEIFPNPTSGILQLKVPEAKKFSVLNCTLTASDGKYIQGFSACADRISDRLSESVKMLQSGIYFLTIREKQTLQTLKLVKN